MNAWLTWLISLTCIALLTTCTTRWYATPDPVAEFKKCNPLTTDEIQMVFVPDYGDTSILVQYCHTFRRERVSIALRYFENEWNRLFGQSTEVYSNMRNLMITFSNENRKISNGYSEDGVKLNGAKLLGVTVTKSTIWVYVPNWTERICDTSLVHELVHASIWASNKSHADPDHLGLRYLGWDREHSKLIQDVNAELCKLGI